jgi:hypothetical protein
LFLQNKDLPEDSNHPQKIDPDHDIGFDAEMEDDYHDDTYIDDNDVDADADADGDDHDQNGDDDVEVVAGSNQ